jgi:hypothetical protein
MKKKLFIFANIFVLIGAICLLFVAKNEPQVGVAIIIMLSSTAALWRHEMYLKK